MIERAEVLRVQALVVAEDTDVLTVSRTVLVEQIEHDQLTIRLIDEELALRQTQSQPTQESN